MVFALTCSRNTTVFFFLRSSLMFSEHFCRTKRAAYTFVLALSLSQLLLYKPTLSFTLASYAFLGCYFYAWNTESLETKGVQKYDCAPKLCPKPLFFACFLAFLVRFSSWFWVNYAFMQRKNAFLWIKMRFWWAEVDSKRFRLLQPFILKGFSVYCPNAVPKYFREKRTSNYLLAYPF